MTKCSVDWCDSPVLAKGLCNRHWLQSRRHGKVFRTWFDPNVINEIGDGLLEIELRDKKGNIVARTIVDSEDRSIVENHKWHYHVGYAHTKYFKKTRSLHRLILETTCGQQVDHINRDKLDNRRSNLRLCTHQQNSVNHPIRSNNTSGVAGIYWYKRTEKWWAQITHNGKALHLGYYENKEDAIKIRLDAERYYFGDFAPQLGLASSQ